MGDVLRKDTPSICTGHPISRDVSLFVSDVRFIPVLLKFRNAMVNGCVNTFLLGFKVLLQHKEPLITIKYGHRLTR